MARRRYLSTDAGRDKAVRDLAVKEPHAATFYLLSIPAAGDDATFPSTDPEELLGEIWPVMARFTPPEDVQRWVDLLTECGLWERCDGAYRLPAESFYRYQTYIRGARRGANAEPEDDPNPVRAPRSLEESRARLKNQLAAEPQRTTPQQSAQRRKSPQNATSFSFKDSSSFSSSSSDSSSPPLPSSPVAPDADAPDAPIRPRDVIWDALVGVFGQPMLDGERNNLNGVCKKFRDASDRNTVPREECAGRIERAAANWSNVMGATSLTPNGLVKHFTLLLEGPQTNGRSNGTVMKHTQSLTESALVTRRQSVAEVMEAHDKRKALLNAPQP